MPSDREALPRQVASGPLDGEPTVQDIQLEDGIVVRSAKGFRVFIGGKHNTHQQWLSIDPGDIPDLVEALEAARERT